MIKIIDSANQTLAILQNIIDPIILEELNREFIFNFITVIDNDKSNHVNYQNKVEANGNYFNIIYTEEERTQEGIFITAQCEHVSYDLLDTQYTAGFTATGVFSAVASLAIGTANFTIGTVASTATETISILEATNARQILLSLASLHDGEIEWDKYAINEVSQRGADRGVQFRYRKNLTGVKRIVDNRKKVGGNPTVSYLVNVAELEFEQSYIDKGYNLLEHYELGDTVRIIDEDLNLDTSLRIVKESHDINQRMQGNVEISNFVDDLADTLTRIETTVVAKNNVYNGCSIGPDLGFVATRSDLLARTIMNATDGIKIQKGDGAGGWTDAIYLDTSGNGTFTGFILASQIIGGSITIGSGSNVFMANDTDGIWLGATAFATALFKVTTSGSATANDLTLTGGLIDIGTGTNTFQFNITDGLFLGATSVSTAPFSVTMSGAMTATDFTLTGGLIRTAPTGERIELYNDSISCYNSSNNLHGFSTESASATFGDAFYYENGTKVLEFYNNLAGAGYSIRSVGAASMFLGGYGQNTRPEGLWDFSLATEVAGLDTSVHHQPHHNHGIPNGTVLTTATGSVTWVESGGFSHNHSITEALYSKATRSDMGASLSGSAKWYGGALGNDGKIYGIPYSSTDILIINPTTGSAIRTTLGASLTGTAKWAGGVLANNGKIYGIPYDSTDILIINPTTGSATRTTMGASLTGTAKWEGGALGNDGKIYGIPRNSTDILIINPTTGSATRTTMGASLSGSGKWAGGALGNDGKIYGIPYSSTDILIINPTTGSAIRTTMGANLTGNYKWTGGILGNDGKIYGISNASADILIINTTTGSATRSDMGASLSGSAKWYGGALGNDGKIYGIPTHSIDILVINTTTGSAIRTTLGADLSGSAKWTGDGILGNDGKIYGIPYNSTDILIIGPAT